MWTVFAGGFKNVDRSGSFRQNEATSHLPRLQGRKVSTNIKTSLYSVII